MTSEEASAEYANHYFSLADNYLFIRQTDGSSEDVRDIDKKIAQAQRKYRKENSTHSLADPRDVTEDFFEYYAPSDDEVLVAARMITSGHDFLLNFSDIDLRYFMDYATLYRISAIEKMLMVEDAQEIYYGTDASKLSGDETFELMKELADLQDLHNYLKQRVANSFGPERE